MSVSKNDEPAAQLPHNHVTRFAASQPLQAWLNPNWRAIALPQWRRLLGVPNLFQPAAGREALAMPLPEDFCEVIGGIYSLPPIQGLAAMTYAEAAQRVRELDDAPLSPDAPLKVVYTTGQFLGSALASIVAETASRQTVVNVLQDCDIPVPNMRGLSFKFRPGRGGALPAGGPGLGGGGQLRLPDVETSSWEAGVFFNITAFAQADI